MSIDSEKPEVVDSTEETTAAEKLDAIDDAMSMGGAPSWDVVGQAAAAGDPEAIALITNWCALVLEHAGVQ